MRKAPTHILPHLAPNSIQTTQNLFCKAQHDNMPLQIVCLNPGCIKKSLICRACADKQHKDHEHQLQSLHYFKQQTMKDLSANKDNKSRDQLYLSTLRDSKQNITKKLNELESNLGFLMRKVRLAVNNQFQILIRSYQPNTYQNQLKDLQHNINFKKIQNTIYKLKVLERNQFEGKTQNIRRSQLNYINCIDFAFFKLKELTQQFNKIKYIHQLQASPALHQNGESIKINLINNDKDSMKISQQKSKINNNYGDVIYKYSNNNKMEGNHTKQKFVVNFENPFAIQQKQAANSLQNKSKMMEQPQIDEPGTDQKSNEKINDVNAQLMLQRREPTIISLSSGESSSSSSLNSSSISSHSSEQKRRKKKKRHLQRQRSRAKLSSKSSKRQHENGGKDKDREKYKQLELKDKQRHQKQRKIKKTQSNDKQRQKLSKKERQQYNINIKKRDSKQQSNSRPFDKKNSHKNQQHRKQQSRKQQLKKMQSKDSLNGKKMSEKKVDDHHITKKTSQKTKEAEFIKKNSQTMIKKLSSHYQFNQQYLRKQQQKKKQEQRKKEKQSKQKVQTMLKQIKQIKVKFDKQQPYFEMNNNKRPTKHPHLMSQQQLQDFFYKYYGQNKPYSLVLADKMINNQQHAYLYNSKNFKWYSYKKLRQQYGQAKTLKEYQDSLKHYPK